MIKPKPDVLPYRFVSIAILPLHTYTYINRTPASNWNTYINLWLDVIIQFSSKFGSICFLYGYTIFYAIPKRIPCIFFFIFFVHSTMQFALQICNSILLMHTLYALCIRIHSITVAKKETVLTSGINLYGNQKRTQWSLHVCEYVRNAYITITTTTKKPNEQRNCISFYKSYMHL